MATLADWRPGRQIDLATRKKAIFAQGLGSFTGARTFAPIERELIDLGFEADDFLETTPLMRAGSPQPYRADDLLGPLQESVRGTRDCLAWYLGRLPAGQEVHAVGYSLGGVLLIRALADLATERPATIAGRVRSVITLNAPLAGLPAAAPGVVGTLIGAGRWLPQVERLLDPIIRDLLAEGRDPTAEARRHDEFVGLVTAGLSVTVIGSLDDQMVAPIRVAPELPGLERIEIVNEAPIRPSFQVDRLLGRLLRGGQEHGLPVPGLDRPGAAGFWFGHSAILTDPAALLAVWQQIGRQERTGDAGA